MEEDCVRDYKAFLKGTKGLSDGTINLYCYWLKDFDLSKASQEYINEYVEERGNHSIIRGALLNLFECTGMNKMFDMPPKLSGTKKKRIIRDISKIEIKLLKEYLYTQSFRNGLMFELVYQGALRRLEVPTIKLNSFRWIEWLCNQSEPCNLIVKGKGNKERTVLINPETANSIFKVYANKFNINSVEGINQFANSPSLLFMKDGKQISEKYVWKIIHNGSIKTLNRDIRTHEIRHERAKELERMGVNIKDIKNYLGHSALSTTEIYLNTSEEKSLDNVKNIMYRKTHQE